jgi:hypothetical protein
LSGRSLPVASKLSRRRERSRIQTQSILGIYAGQACFKSLRLRTFKLTKRGKKDII